MVFLYLPKDVETLLMREMAAQVIVAKHREPNVLHMANNASILAPFDPTKKKKMKVVILDPIEDSTESQAEKTDSSPRLLMAFRVHLLDRTQTVATVISGLILLSINYRFQRHHIFTAKKWGDEHGDWRPSWKLLRIILDTTRCSRSSRNFSIYLTKGSHSSSLRQWFGRMLYLILKELSPRAESRPELEFLNSNMIFANLARLRLIGKSYYGGRYCKGGEVGR
ncbi:hypothetical protein DY000_02055852 [Brassica cretica]|uniref:Uncharacterized protein n=1 Tax=Brassica cretica TaxID=69181 RepID=A0ABQ7A6X7_BRACR|nr:hypothetical protein DY000_02055852 [Brassica cretica]